MTGYGEGYNESVSPASTTLHTSTTHHTSRNMHQHRGNHYDNRRKSWSGGNSIYTVPGNYSYRKYSPSSLSKSSMTVPLSGSRSVSRSHSLSRSASPSSAISSCYYNAIENCKSAGIIPYCIHNGTLLFLFQRTINPHKKKDAGYNDFGGKRMFCSETTAEIAAREFSEETSCLFYLKENAIDDMYNMLKDNAELSYDDAMVEYLKNTIPLSQKYFADRITEYVSPIYISSREVYISYFIKVEYLPESDLPRAEDIHVKYDERYIRECKWFTIDELTKIDEKDFHKRLQITKLQNRINTYWKKGVFV